MYYFCSVALLFASLLAKGRRRVDKVNRFSMNGSGLTKRSLVRCANCCTNYSVSGLLTLLLLASNNSIGQERLLYRYTNENGVKVLTYSMPAQYISKGYEIIDVTGRLVKIIPPELSPEDKARAEAARAESERLQIWDQQLLKRYSRVSDIEAAKQRKLAEISANINILRGNVVNLNNEINKMQAKAATIQRGGQPISDTILDNIEAVKAEIAVITHRIQLRQKEYRAHVDKFDKDIARFLMIRPESEQERERK